jgi:hypothetical protein
VQPNSYRQSSFISMGHGRQIGNKPKPKGRELRRTISRGQVHRVISEAHRLALVQNVELHLTSDARQGDDTTGDVPPPRTLEERIFAALAMDGQTSLNVFQLAVAVYGRSRAFDELDGLEKLTVEMVESMALVVDFDGRLMLPASGGGA